MIFRSRQFRKVK